MHPTPPPRGELNWVGIDFDGTLAEGVWSPDNPTAALGPPIEANVDKCRQLAAAGCRIVIHTSRPSSDHEAISWWCGHYGVPVHQILTGKPLCAIYVDDRAVHADDDWLERLKAINGKG